jgi:beta-lactamase superfamily II metal-dependent hydrolase
MKFALEALQAQDGDCFLLHFARAPQKAVRILIDGGSRGVYAKVLKPRLEELRAGKKLDLRMVLVSHIDADHITGIEELLKNLQESEKNGEELPYRIATLWHNSFETLTKNKTAEAQSAAVRASLEGSGVTGLDEQVSAVVASVPQGNRVRRYAKELGIRLNQGAQDDLVRAPKRGQRVVEIATGLRFTILGPSDKQLADLDQEWQKAKSAHVDPEAQAADYLNRTVPNLSSIVLLAEAEISPRGPIRRILLTGDAGGDLILEGLEDAKLLRNGSIHVDLLKVQHHGSMHSVTQEFFAKVTADRYVISGNGKHKNPHRKTLEWLSAARTDRPYDAYLTNRTGQDLEEMLEEFLAQEQTRQPGHRYHFRSDPALSITVALD